MQKTDFSTIENNKEPKKKVGRIIFYIVSVILIMVLTGILCDILITKKKGKPPVFFGYSMFLETVDIKAQYPQSGSAVFVKSLDPKSIKINDEIIVRDRQDDKEAQLFTRSKVIDIIENNNEISYKVKIVSKQNEEEKIFTANDIIGEIAFTIPYVGKVFAFIKTPFGLTICIAIPLIILLVLEIINLIHLTKAGKNNKLSEIVEIEPENDDVVTISNEEKIYTLSSEQDNKSERLNISKNHEIIEESNKIHDDKTSLKTPFMETPITLAKDEGLKNKNQFENKSAQQSATSDINQSDTEIHHDDNDNKNHYNDKNDLLASIKTTGKDRFDIEGIQVKVQPDSLNLIFDKKDSDKDISIIVTKDYTNVVIQSSDCQLNFALFKDETDDEQKVIIQKKAK